MPQMSKEQLTLHGMDTKKGEYRNRQEVDTSIAIQNYPPAPTRFRQKTRQAWKKTVGQLVNLRQLTESDMVNLEMMFDSYDRYWIAVDDLEKHNKIPVMKRDKAWYAERTRLEKMVDNQKDRFWSESSDFGMTPKSRRQVLSIVDEKQKQTLKEKVGITEWKGSLSI